MAGDLHRAGLGALLGVEPMKARITFQDGTFKIITADDPTAFRQMVESDPEILHAEIPVDDEPGPEDHEGN